MTDTEFRPIGRVKGHPRVRRPRLTRAKQVPPAPNRGTEAPAQHGLVEWHAMSPQERATNWAELCTWVIWLYDRYELSVESRLPECWAEHPGLIEELWALMVWRREIYGSGQPGGQAARYWHTELRVLTSHALSYYASGCRTGHRAADRRAVDSPTLQERWHGADPWTAIPPTVLAAQGMMSRPLPSGTMSGAAMQTALSAGHAVPLSPAIPEYARLKGSWWLNSGEGHWILVTDEGFAARLDASATSMAEATAATQRRRAARELFTNAASDHDHGSRA